MSILGLTLNVIRPSSVGPQDSYPVIVVGVLTARLLIRTQPCLQWIYGGKYDPTFWDNFIPFNYTRSFRCLSSWRYGKVSLRLFG